VCVLVGGNKGGWAELQGQNGRSGGGTVSGTMCVGGGGGGGGVIVRGDFPLCGREQDIIWTLISTLAQSRVPFRQG
jgi:hypothetical protein